MDEAALNANGRRTPTSSDYIARTPIMPAWKFAYGLTSTSRTPHSPTTVSCQSPNSIVADDIWLELIAWKPDIWPSQTLPLHSGVSVLVKRERAISSAATAGVVT